MAASAFDATSVSAVENLTELVDLKKAFEMLCKQEAEVESELMELFKHQNSLESKMASLHTMMPNLHILETDSRQLNRMICFTSDLAENVSGKVRKLDLAKSRVVESSQRVEDILDLKFCTDGVQIALQNEDYEKAAGHIHRFRKVDETVLRMETESNEGSSLDTSFKLLYESEEKLKTIVETKFDNAVHSQDVASVQRFFKIFPMLAMYEKGVTKFSKYLAAQLSEKADSNLKLALQTADGDKRSGVLFADTITLLFEGIARVVEIHQPLVETYYGPGKLFGMLVILQKECDRQTRKIVEQFKKKRHYDKLVRQVQQSMALHQKQASGDRLDPRELDVILSEVALINARAELYMRFMRRRALSDLEVANPDEEHRKGPATEIEAFWTGCDLSRMMQELIGVYIMMEEYFMREMIFKAVSMDSVEEGQFTSSMVDDTFFIVKKSVRRAISSSSIDGVCAMLNHASTILEQEFREVIYAGLRLGFPCGFDLQQAYNLVQASITQGKLQSSDAEKVKARASFLTSLNNAEVSCDYCRALKNNLEDEVSKLYVQLCTEQSKAKLQSCLTDLGSVSERFKDVVEFGFTQLASTAIKPRIKPLLDNFMATSHNITEEEFSYYEANDPWVQATIVTLDAMLTAFKTSLTAVNFNNFVNLVTTEITTQLEKSVSKTSFNRLGGLQFDKELRALVGYLSSVTTWTVRDKFARLTQMGTILNLERVPEIMDYWGQNSGPLTWRLTPAEVRQTLNLRADFQSDDIKRLKL